MVWLMNDVAGETSLDTVATIDLAPLADASDAGRREVADALRSALERVGFFILVNHGVSRALIQRTFGEAERFHDQPMEAKHAVLMNEHNNGYMAMHRYNVRTSRVSEVAKSDRNEAFFIKRERSPDDPMALAGRRFAGPNEWPENLPGFRENLLEYTEAVDTMARGLMPSLAMSLDLPADTFDAAFAESQFSFRLSHYPPVTEQEAGQYGIAPHTDANFMTFLAQSEVPGLQIRVGDENWLDIPYVPDSFVVNSGDMLHRWTNGRYKSTPHRALPPIGRTRYAIPYFFGPHLDTVIECLKSCQGVDNAPQFPPITYSDYVVWWYDANYNAKDQQDLAQASAPAE
jgi:isopenicillin N synthase-like dioxygenase